MIVYLLIDEKELRYAKKWQVFANQAACLEEAKGRGFVDYGLPFGNEPGMRTLYAGGPNDVNLSIVVVEVQSAEEA